MASDESSNPPGFHYTSISHNTNEIRLLRVLRDPGHFQNDHLVQCNIIHTSLNSAPDYQALSYTWGEEVAHPPFILLEGRKFPVRPNLHSALAQLKSGHLVPEFLWVDGICINQNDVEEKNSQVCKMKDIFQRASQVIVWLGSSNFDSGAAFTLLHSLNTCQSSSNKIREIIQDPNRAYEWKALINLFQRSYWRRVWVIQEVQVAKSTVVLCGDESIELSSLLCIQSMLWNEHAAPLINLAHSNTWLRNLHFWIRGRGARGLDQHPQAPPGDLFRTLLFHRLKEATDPRDKIYSLLGLTSARNDIEIDYRSDVRQVYIDTAAYIIHTSGKLDILWAAPPHQDRFNLPSWVPDWSIDEEKQAGLAWGLQETKLEYIYHASGKTKADAVVNREGILFTKGLITSSVAQLGGVTHVRHSRDIQQTVASVNEWRTLMETHQGNGLSCLEAFARTLCCDRVKFEGDRHGTLQEKLLALMATISQLKTVAQVKALKDSTEKEYVSIKAEIEGIAQQIFRRRFVLSSSGTMGLAPEEAQVGDLICILLGCSVPVVLRATGCYFIYIGDVYLDGYMSGRAVAEGNDGKLSFQDFVIL